MALTQEEINEVMQQLQPIIAKALNGSATIEQAQSAIQQGVTQYIGARYVPLFADPIEWDSARAYEPLTIVLHQGNSFTTRQHTPAGIDINNDAFWAETGNYNAQIEQYRQEVLAFDGRISKNTTDIAKLDTELKSDIAKLDTELKSNAGNKYGFAVVLMPPFNTEASVKNRIDLANEAGANNVNICIYIDNDAMTPKDICDYAVSYAKSVGMGVSLKVHGNTSTPQGYVNLVANYLDLLTEAPNTVFIYNEPGKAYIEANESVMLSTISAIKAKGYTVGIALNLPSIQAADKLIDRCDIVGVNLYPSQGYSLSYSVESMMETLSRSFKYMTAKITKKVWVTETGILPRKCFLFAPEVYNLSDGYPSDSNIGREVDYNVATSFYRAAIKALSNCCDNLILWYGETSLTDENAKLVRSA